MVHLLVTAMLSFRVTFYIILYSARRPFYIPYSRISDERVSCLFLVIYPVVILCSKTVFWYYIELQIVVTTEGIELTLFVEFNKVFVTTFRTIKYRPPSGYGATDMLPYSQ